MSTSTDLMGSGLPAALANLIGNDISNITCAGTSSTTATLIQTEVSVLSAASSQTGAILPASMPIGAIYWVTCTSSTSAVVYPPSGATFNLTGGGASLTVAQFKSAAIIRLTATTFMSVLTA